MVEIRRVSDWIPARRVADERVVFSARGRRGVAQTPFSTVKKVVAAPAPAARPLPLHWSGAPPQAAAPAQARGKKRVPPTQVPPVQNGPLAQRAERAKRSLRGTRGHGVGKGGAAIYTAEFQRQKNGLIEEIAATQKSLDKIDGTLIGVDSQLQALGEAAGYQAPQDVLSAVDQARNDRRAFGDSVQVLRDTIDRLNTAAQQVQEAEASGQAGPFSPAQQSLEKSYKESRTLAAQVQSVQRAASTLIARVESATVTVNRYVDRINAEASSYLEAENRRRQAEQLAYEQSEQERRLAEARAAQEAERQRAAEEQRLRLEREAAERQAAREAEQAALERQREELRRRTDEALAEQQRRFEELRAAAEAQQAARDAARAAAAPQYLPPAPPPPPPSFMPQWAPPQTTQLDIYLPDYGAPASGPAYSPQAYAPPSAPQYVPDSVPLSAPSSEGFGAATGWGGQVWGYEGRGGGVGFTPVAQPMVAPQQPQGTSASVVVKTQAREILAARDVELARARKELERQRLAEEEAAKKKVQEEGAAVAVASPRSFWTPKKKVAAGLGLLALGAGLFAATR